MMTNITVANFAGDRHVTRTSAVYQYDYGQILQFSGLDLPSAYEVHFSNQESIGTSKTSIGNEDGVVIPDEYLLSGEKVYAWIFLHEGLDDGETEYKITIPVNKRARPTDIEPTPVQQDVITQTIAELNSAVEKVSQAVANSPKIEDGTWHVWDADNEVWVDTGVKAEGIDGTDGVDGVSPVISTEPIENGHRITFTDKDGTHVITLVNGAKGDTGPAGATGPAGPKGDTGDPGPRGETGATGPKGDTGSAGPQGERGTDGVSPTVAVTPISGGHSVAITDGTGTKSFNVLDGQDGQPGQDGQSGQDGQDGFSPSASVSKSGTVTTITVTDKNGTTTAQVNDGQNGQPGASGQDGQPGADGYSPSASVSKSGTVSTLTVTDKTGTTTVQINDGQDGQPGQDGQDGEDGESGVYIGSTAPSDPDVNVWIDTSGEGDVITVSGTNPVINGVSNTRYLCGEVSTISITPPQSGIIDVIFTSGSSVAVLTVPSTVKWPSGFDPTSLETNTTYELNIMDGVYGAVMSWT